MLVHAYSLCNVEAEAGGSLRDRGQPDLHSYIVNSETD